MIRSGFDGERPLYTLTVGEFIELLDQRLGEIIKNGQSQQENPAGTSHVVYGLRGIQQLFGCSHKTAQYYKDHVIQEAVFQNGRKIVVDAELALQLFNNRGAKTKSQTFLMRSYRKKVMPARRACNWPYFTGMPSSRMLGAEKNIRRMAHGR